MWFTLIPDRLSERARVLLADRDNELILSAASAWEVAIKESTGKLRLPDPADVYLPHTLDAQGIQRLPISHVHALRVASLPLHHRDPFDRLIIAQAQIEQLTILTSDPQFAPYDVTIISAS